MSPSVMKEGQLAEPAQTAPEPPLPSPDRGGVAAHGSERALYVSKRPYTGVKGEHRSERAACR